MRVQTLEAGQGALVALLIIGFLFGPGVRSTSADTPNQSNTPAPSGARIFEGGFGIVTIAIGVRALGFVLFHAWTGTMASVGLASVGSAVFLGFLGLGAMFVGAIILWDAIFNKGQLIKCSALGSMNKGCQ